MIGSHQVCLVTRSDTNWKSNYVRQLQLTPARVITGITTGLNKVNWNRTSQNRKGKITPGFLRGSVSLRPRLGSAWSHAYEDSTIIRKLTEAYMLPRNIAHSPFQWNLHCPSKQSPESLDFDTWTHSSNRFNGSLLSLFTHWANTRANMILAHKLSQLDLATWIDFYRWSLSLTRE